MKTLKHSKLFKSLGIVSLFLLATVACSPFVVSSNSDQTTPVIKETLVETTTVPIPDEELVDQMVDPETGQLCSYLLDLPEELQTEEETPYSKIYFIDQEGETRNFIYVSVIDAQVLSLVASDAYDYEVYNFDPNETDILLNMEVGESKAVREVANTASWFTYERLPDAQIGGYNAQVYQNLQPWEFPEGTKEIRYYVLLDECTFLIGAYLDTTQSGQLDAISEELFNKLVESIQLNQ